MDHLNFFKFIGRIIGKAIFDGHLLECYFAKPLYKMILGEDLCFADLEDLDNDYWRNLKWSIDNDVEDLEYYFAVDQDHFGKREVIELIPNGSNIKVTNENKQDYVEKLAYFKMYSNIKKQVDALLSGFYDLIPKELVSIFNHKELELLIAGLPEFDLADLKAHSEFIGYTSKSPQI